MAQHQAGGSGMGSCGPPAFCTLQGGNAMHDVSTAIAIGFVEQSKRLRAAHYRAEAEVLGDRVLRSPFTEPMLLLGMAHRATRSFSA